MTGTFVSYAQNFEDVRLWRAFSDIAEGRYLDIGTQDPVHDSVSLAFYQRGWRGVHVEPTPAYAAAMRAARPDETVIEAAVSSNPGPILFFEIPETGLSTGVRDIAERHVDAGWPLRELKVPTVTLAGLFDLMGNAPIQWLKVDVEGMEADVLESWGDHPARPAALVIEATAPNTQVQTHEAWYDWILSRGYRDVLFDGLSRFFIHEKHAERGAALALSPNVFDDFLVAPSHFVARKLAAEREAAVQGMQQQAEADCQAALAAALQQAEAVRLTEIAGLQQQAEAERQAALAAALTQAEAQHLDAVAALRQQAEAERATALAAALQQAEAVRLTEIAGLQQQAEAERQAALAAALTQAEAQHLDAVAALRQQAEAERATALAATKAEAAAVLDAIRSGLDARVAAGEQALAEVRQALVAQQQHGQALAREAGRLEGQLAAQIEADAARRRDAEAVRRDLAMRLGRSEQALTAARVNGAELREKIQLLTGEHALSLIRASAALETAEARAAQMGEQLAAVSRHLTESEAKQNQAERQRDEAVQHAAMQADTHAAELERLHSHIAWREGQLTASEVNREQAERQRDEAVQHAAMQADTHAAELERLHAYIAWREEQLQQASRLFDQAPDPLAGWPRRVAALLARITGWQPEGTMADHAVAVEAWRANNALPALEASERTGIYLAGHPPMSDLGPVWKDLDMSGGEDPVTSVPRLLAPHDAEFIWTAYKAVLGRAPDQEGGAYYLNRLRSGVHKLEIIKQLRRSPEGREFIPGVAGLDRAIRSYRLAKLPVLGILVRWLTGDESDSQTLRRLRSVSNDINVLIERTNRSFELLEQVHGAVSLRELQVEIADLRDRLSSAMSAGTAQPPNIGSVHALGPSPTQESIAIAAGTVTIGYAKQDGRVESLASLPSYPATTVQALKSLLDSDQKRL